VSKAFDDDTLKFLLLLFPSPPFSFLPSSHYLPPSLPSSLFFLLLAYFLN
jgi:hypothetical protein